MSKKPEKKSNKNQSWRNPRKDEQRPIKPTYHLIVTEGTKTEPYYFRGLKNEIDAHYPDRIFIKEGDDDYVSIKIKGIGQGYNTLTLLERAEQLYMDAIKKHGIEYKHVWLVYDKDSFPKDDFDNTYSKCGELSNENVTYHALWSNECIEYWFLLHYKYLDSALSRSEYYPLLTNCLQTKYKKNREDIYQLLKPHQKKAIAHAKK